MVNRNETAIKKFLRDLESEVLLVLHLAYLTATEYPFFGLA